MYEASFAGRLNIAARCAALLLALGCLQACSSGEGTRPNDPPVQNPPPPPPPAAASPPPTGEPSGLDARPSNTTCLAWDRPAGDDTISLTRYTNLTFSSPVAMLQDPGDNSRWFIVQQDGNVRTFPTSNPTTHTGFIDISGARRQPRRDRQPAAKWACWEWRSIPNFPQDPRVFLSYTNANRTSIISSFRTTNNGATLDPGTEQQLLTIDHPQTNHNGGNIAFGPDGLLYIGIGDGGGAGDDHGNTGNGQSCTTMLGKMLRIDVGAASATTYTIPDGQSVLQRQRQ